MAENINILIFLMGAISVYKQLKQNPKIRNANHSKEVISKSISLLKIHVMFHTIDYVYTKKAANFLPAVLLLGETVRSKAMTS